MIWVKSWAKNKGKKGFENHFLFIRKSTSVQWELQKSLQSGAVCVETQKVVSWD
jgi:hypothetical protein